jgi:Bifunctional DNA primase/polymerase, N-terminal/Primase C terminal 1 (PriCT-1)
MPRAENSRRGPERGAANGYAALGLAVFPVRRDKSPLTRNGHHAATTNAEQIEAWWTLHGDAGIGMACEASGMLVLDVDPRHGGDGTLRRLESERGELPHGPRSRTGGGGWHYFFRAPAGIRPRGQLGPGLDVKFRGYVVLPPSLHASGCRYEWFVGLDDAPLPGIPNEWLPLFTCANSSSATASGHVEYRQVARIPEGTRNTTLTKIAGAIRRAGVDAEGVEAALLVVNEHRCQPPLVEQEVRRIARSIGSRSTAPSWALDAVAFANAGGEQLTSAQWSVLVVLCHRADDRGRVIGGTWISREAHVAYSTAKRALRALERQGRITVERQPCRSENGHAYWLPNIYHLIEPTGVGSQ